MTNWKPVNAALVAVIACAFIACTPLGIAQPVKPVDKTSENDSGTVIEFTTRQPIEGATVRMECLKPKFHGDSVLWVEERVTAADGSYSFRGARLSECPQIMIHATKATYWDAGGIPNVVPWNPNERIPAHLFLVEDRNVHMLRMEQLFLDSGLTQIRPAQNPTGSQFSRAFRSFGQTRRLAVGESDHIWIHNKYCGPMMNIVSRLSASDRKDYSEVDYGDTSSFIEQISTYCK